MPKMFRKYANLFFALLMMLLPLRSCVGDPLPQPPTFQYALVSIDGLEDSDSVVILGEEGATDPRSTLQFFNFNLDPQSFNVFSTTAMDDGSFTITMPGWRINKYRVVVNTGGFDPMSVDFHGNWDGSISVTDLPIYDCFIISDMFLDFGDVEVGPDSWKFMAVELTNTCSEMGTIEINDIYLSDRDNFSVFHSSFPATVDVGRTGQIGLQFSPVSEGEIIKNLEVAFSEGEKSYDIKIILRGNAVIP